MILIDEGHGCDTHGKRAGNLHEWEFNRKVGKFCELVCLKWGVEHQILVPEEKDIGLRTRVVRASESPARFLVSIHGNAFKDESVHGLETWYYSLKGKTFATIMQRELVTALGWKDRGIKKGNFTIIKKTPQIACLVELGFYTNPEQREEMLKEENQYAMARAIITGYLETEDIL